MYLNSETKQICFQFSYSWTQNKKCVFWLRCNQWFNAGGFPGDWKGFRRGKIRVSQKSLSWKFNGLTPYSHYFDQNKTPCIFFLIWWLSKGSSGNRICGARVKNSLFNNIQSIKSGGILLYYQMAFSMGCDDTYLLNKQ